MLRSLILCLKGLTIIMFRNCGFYCIGYTHQLHNLQQVLIAHGIADICLPNNVTALPLARVLDTTHRTRRHCFYSLPACMKHPLMTKTHWGESSRNHPCPLKPDLPQGAVARAKARVRAAVRAKATARVRANAGG